MIGWIKTILSALGVVFIAAVIGAVPPLPSFFAWVDVHQTTIAIGTGALAFAGLMLMMGGIIDLIMSQDRSLSHAEAEDVERSVRMAAQPVTWRATTYRVWGKAAGSEGSDQFSFADLKRAWRRGVLWRNTAWRRRIIIATGALMMTVGILGTCFTVFPAPIKVLTALALLYVMVRIVWGLWKA